MPSLKHSKALSILFEEIGHAAEAISAKVLHDVGKDDLAGREEIITPQIARDLTSDLISDICERLNNKHALDISFKAHCFKHSEEKSVGADVAGIMTIRSGDEFLSKIYLAQAKIATSAHMRGRRAAKIHAGDRNLLRQCQDMLRVTPASYVFVYSRL